MGKVAWIFPGQGSQYVGMGRLLSETYRQVASALEEAEQILGFELRKLMFEGPEDLLKETRFAQPAIFALSVALGRILQSLGLQPDMVAGHSLGEYSALVVGGAMDFHDALSLVSSRAEAMHYACGQTPGTMYAILGLDGQTVESICRDFSGGVVDVANFNSPEQTVISGEPDAVRKAGDEAKKRGAKRAVPLQVSGAFHSRLMNCAANRFEGAINSAKIRKPVAAFYPNVSAVETADSEQIRLDLHKQICSPVRWQHSLDRMLADGADTFIEVGPGKVLCGLLKRINGSAVSFNTDSPESVAMVREHFNGVIR